MQLKSKKIIEFLDTGYEPTVGDRRENWVCVNVCTAPHHTAPGKIQYRTDGNSRILPTYFVPDPSINFVWYFVF